MTKENAKISDRVGRDVAAVFTMRDSKDSHESGHHRQSVLSNVGYRFPWYACHFSPFVSTKGVVYYSRLSELQCPTFDDGIFGTTGVLSR